MHVVCVRFEIPRARFETIGFRGQCADRTEFGDVAGKVVLVFLSVCCGNDVAYAAIFDDQLAFFCDDVVEANATLTDDAAFLVEDDRGTEIDRFRF